MMLMHHALEVTVTSSFFFGDDCNYLNFNAQKANGGGRPGGKDRNASRDVVWMTQPMCRPFLPLLHPVQVKTEVSWQLLLLRS